MKRIFSNSKIIKRFFSENINVVEKTALYDFHVENGGKMIDFGGFLLPVQYNDLGINASHIHTRKNASIFDVSHMLQTEVRGEKCLEYLESVCTADLKNLPVNSSTLTLFTNNQGGILDDLIITKIAEDHLYIVSNAAMKNQDQQILTDALKNFHKINPKTQIDLKFFDTKEMGLLAFQGPKAANLLQRLTDVDLTKLYFMRTTVGKIGNVENCRITRCGYTGEDGFEIRLSAKNLEKLTKSLLKESKGDVKMAGLGARDSLRLEAGLCLYGNDMDSSTTPVEAALTWLVSKRRREKMDFPGAAIILDQIKNGASRKRIGIVTESGPAPRRAVKIFDANNDEPIGIVTSGCPSPTLGKNVAMGYVTTMKSTNKEETKVSLEIRGKRYEGIVAKTPFVKTNYYVRPKNAA